MTGKPGHVDQIILKDDGSEDKSMRIQKGDSEALFASQ